METATRPAPRAIIPLACGCEAQDAAWYGRLVLAGRSPCAAAAAILDALAAASRSQSACGNPPRDEFKAQFREAQHATAVALADLAAHVEANRPREGAEE